jgi:RNA polymerase sigma-70 factor, ECF subfamily
MRAGVKTEMPESRVDFFSRLFSESQAGLKRYVRRLVRSRDTADEIVQEAFLRTYKHGDRKKAPKAFLYSIARNLATDSRRRDRVAQTDTVADLEAANVPTPRESLDAGLLAEERSRLLKDAVERLPPQCRTVFTLKVFYEFSYREISEKLGISTKTVENHIAHGVRETHRYLRRQYKEGNSDHG